MYEIITLQLGQRSNYLATHFWNAQESYFTYSGEQESPVDHDVHFRPGIGADGAETFTPRTVIYDLKGGFGSLRKINALYETTTQEDGLSLAKGSWDGPTATHILPSIEENQYLRSLNEGVDTPELTTETVRYWSDFNRVFYHPRSIIQLNEYEINSSLMPFERWEAGEELFSTLDKEHDILDRDVRPFAEESDQLQGLQIMSGVDDAWGGFAARYTDALRDEFGKASIWIWGSRTGNQQTRERQAQKTVNSARSCLDLSSQASLYVPLTDPPPVLPSYVLLDPRSEWHTAALLSSAIESVTTPSRLRAMDSSRYSLLDIESIINTNGNQRIARLQFSVPRPDNDIDTPKGQQNDPRLPPSPWAEDKPVDEPAELRSALVDLTKFDVDFTGNDYGVRENRSTPPRTFGQIEVDKGDESVALDRPHSVLSAPYRQAADAPRVKRLLHFLFSTVAILVFRTSLAYPILDSFPGIYGAESKRAGKVSVRAGLSSDTSMAKQIQNMSLAVKRLVGPTERETLCNGLSEIAEAYQEGWDSGSDPDSDDD